MKALVFGVKPDRYEVLRLHATSRRAAVLAVHGVRLRASGLALRRSLAGPLRFCTAFGESVYRCIVHCSMHIV